MENDADNVRLRDDENENFADVDLSKAVETAEYVKAYGMAGIMTWSINRYKEFIFFIIIIFKRHSSYRLYINRDTNHRIEPVGSCTDLQAGYEDGTYLRTIHSALNN